MNQWMRMITTRNREDEDDDDGVVDHQHHHSVILQIPISNNNTTSTTITSSSNNNNHASNNHFNPNIYYSTSPPPSSSINNNSNNIHHHHHYSDNDNNNHSDDHHRRHWQEALAESAIIQQHEHDEDDDDNQSDTTPQQRAKEFRLKLTCIFSAMILFASFGLPLLILCTLYASLIQNGPTGVNDQQAMIIPLTQLCKIERIWINCFVRQYTRVCYYQVSFNESSASQTLAHHEFDVKSFLPPHHEFDVKGQVTHQSHMNDVKSVITSSAYDIFKEPFRSLRVNDSVKCYVNRNLTKLSIVEPSSELYDRYQVFMILLGVFGGICCTFSMCSWVALFAKSK